MIARQVFIIGRVQGVGYRDWLRSKARQNGLSGWVRNRLDGSVEALLVGAPGEVANLITACHRGPPLARVEQIIEAEAELPEAAGFHRLPTL